MLQSMTGFGRAEFNVANYICCIEIRTLNGKQFEVNTKLPSILKMYEIEVRNKTQQSLNRGSIDVTIFLKQNGSSKAVSVNIELAKYYHNAITQIADELALEKKDILSTLMSMPEIVSSSNETFKEEDWLLIAQKLEEVCQIVNQYRTQEGVMLTTHQRQY